jgi:hypothetical protein
MSTSQQVSTKAREIVESAGRAFASEHPTSYRAFDQKIRELEALAREAFQAKLKGDYRTIVDKLEQGQPLSGEDHELLKLLIVGEANYYLKYENDLQHWQAELKRLTEEIERLVSTGLNDVDSLLHVQALCRDARAVLPDIIFYLQEKDRLARFEKATQGPLDVGSGRLLADLIKQMMASPEM